MKVSNVEWMTTKNEPGKTYLMQGNEAIVRGALEGGVHFASSYPGSPSSQVLGMLGHIAEDQGFRAEWSTNETTALQSELTEALEELAELQTAYEQLLSQIPAEVPAE